jgi:hypothetical protein
MEKFRKNLLAVTLCGLSAIVFTFSSCTEEKEPVYSGPTIAVDIVASNPGKIQFLVAVTAPAGLKEVTVGDVVKSYTADKTSDIYTYEYTGTATSLTFTVTDIKGKTADETAAIKPIQVVDVNITSDVSWSSDKQYLLKGNIFVTNNAKLTIAPGTVILGDKVSKGSLVIERGSQLIAAGTVAQPIVFTSSAPAGFRNYGDWGGLVILGKAVNNQGTNVNIEGITAGNLGQYGGAIDNDNSGIITYVRIEFAGIALSTDNELNGVTFGSVGSGTTFNHVQVSYSGDDSFEWFGGKVNATHLVAYRGWDDDFDTDFGYSGKVQFAASFRDPDIADKSGSNIFESDNDGAGSANTPLTSAIFANVTAFGPFAFARLSSGALNNGAASANYQNGAHIRRNSALQIWNSVIVGAGTSLNFPLRFTNSSGGGANTAAVVKGNYIARALSASSITPTSGATDKGYLVDNFAVDNTVESPLNKVDLSTMFTGLTGAADINNPKASVVLATTSPLATGAIDLTGAGLNQTAYKGAVGTTIGWLGEAWVNFSPQTTQY